VTSNANGDPLPSIFTEEYLSNGDSKLEVATSDLADSKDYLLQLWVYYGTFQAETTTKVDFMVRIVNPCANAVLTIDDTIFKPPPTLTMLQYVNYDP